MSLRAARAIVGGALLLLLTASTNGEDSPVAASDRDVDRFTEQLRSAANQVRDYVCTLTKQERVDGELQPVDTIVLKQRREPRCVYMKWTDGPDRGREAIHCPAKYGGKLKVHETSGVASWLTLSLDPSGSLAMEGERHPITEAGIFFTVDRVLGMFAADRIRLRFERPARPQCLMGTHVVPAAGYAHRVEICLEPEHSLPALVEVWDPSGALLERYAYSDYRTNVGLGDRDFDLTNPAYGF